MNNIVISKVDEHYVITDVFKIYVKDTLDEALKLIARLLDEPEKQQQQQPDWIKEVLDNTDNGN